MFWLFFPNRTGFGLKSNYPHVRLHEPLSRMIAEGHSQDQSTSYDGNVSVNLRECCPKWQAKLFGAAAFPANHRHQIGFVNRGNNEAALG
ncbi:MAG TPA: hypothetical protein DDW73_22575 [Rhizobium sp.]|nr:hypothetical protein [Rhizobium sp.]